MRFYSTATFGAREAQINQAQDIDAATLLRAQLDAPRRAYLPRVRALYDSYDGNGRRNRAHTSVFWADAIAGDDQLRQRMVFALSQMLVASDRPMANKPRAMAFYMDALGEHAFGNYRDLLEAVTYTPAMGAYLTYRGNRKGDERTGRTPDENYARELLQLFSIGLVELNMDGTPKTGSDGEAIETYGNDDILGLARVFTGLDREKGADNKNLSDADYRPMVIYEDRHSPLEKSFLGTTIPAGTATAESIDLALDAVFEHPNVAPFVSRQLIQRFTASHPEPAYVRRVASAFEAGRFVAANGTGFGTGERGDLEATLAAILLDESQFRDPGDIRTTTDLGKVREPVLNFVHWARAFDVSPVTPENEWTLLYNAGDSSEWLGQMPFASPSVFNFYRPGFVATGTESGDRGLTIPEFQILLSGNRSGWANTMSRYAFDDTGSPDNSVDSLKPDYSDELELAGDPEALAEHLDTLLLGGEMTDDTRAAIEEVVAAIPVRTNTVENTEQDEFRRVAAAVTVATTAPEFMVR